MDDFLRDQIADLLKQHEASQAAVAEQVIQQLANEYVIELCREELKATLKAQRQRALALLLI